MIRAIGLLALFSGSALAQAPAEFSVGIVADAGGRDGTVGPVQVRIYSRASDSWSEWLTVEGIDAGGVRTLYFQQKARWTSVDQVEVYVSPYDSARVSVLVDDGRQTLLYSDGSRLVRGYAEFFSTGTAAAVCCENEDGSGACGSYEECPLDLTQCWGESCGCESPC